MNRARQVGISIHALLAESDELCCARVLRTHRFQSTLSLRRATGLVFHVPHSGKFQSTLSLRRATHVTAGYGDVGFISIHALLAESDLFLVGFAAPVEDFNPRSPCGERQPARPRFPAKPFISIHALLAESDDIGDIPTNISRVFQSTLSLRRATGRVLLGPHRQDISIHALLAESDSRAAEPGGCMVVFQSTLSLRRATGGAALGLVFDMISIHALLAESDGHVHHSSPFRSNFNPRSPCGERPPTADLERR